jgi:hypothetical protein
MQISYKNHSVMPKYVNNSAVAKWVTPRVPKAEILFAFSFGFVAVYAYI